VARICRSHRVVRYQAPARPGFDSRCRKYDSFLLFEWSCWWCSGGCEGIFFGGAVALGTAGYIPAPHRNITDLISLGREGSAGQENEINHQGCLSFFLSSANITLSNLQFRYVNLFYPCTHSCQTATSLAITSYLSPSIKYALIISHQSLVSPSASNPSSISSQRRSSV
jgi:hypothetical protein